jgi:hypothetical protein
MAFSVKIRGVPVEDGASCWSFDNIFWWDMNLVRERLPVREIVDATLYQDYVVIMTPAEAIEWNRSFSDSYRKAHAAAGACDNDAIDRLGQRLESTRDAMRWIVVERYEWESGL